MNRTDVDAVLIKRDAVGLLDDGQHLLDDAGHLVCVGQVAVREAGVDQMQRQCHGLAAGQDTVQVTVEFIDQPRGLRVLGRVQRLDFRLQRICDVDVALRPLHRTGDVVGERHDKRGLRFGLFPSPVAVMASVTSRMISGGISDSSSAIWSGSR